ncbi:hypothetical protein AJ88_03620 [Mesorhizobium amorphae CCBAU 01583]|nr:hypothetical protein AJ88_03620 [Mesorhizobium amorphae CCBAU 01583]
MPVRRKTDRRRSTVPPWDVELDLAIGWLSNRTDECMRSEWERYRDYMLEQNAIDHPGERPYAWWIFDRDMPAPWMRGQADALLEMGEMGADEIAAVRKLWAGAPGAPKFMQEADNAGTPKAQQG